ncbi:MAG: membrane protein insertion efficiency factor YidD [Thermoleophilia bacterium]|nr:membrane protein insertion efficiency factor YidD [Thermoleophilia bacterium]
MNALRTGVVGVGLVYAWRCTVGLLTPPNTCKYHPTCSRYAIEAFREVGLLRGVALTVWRLARCNPWSHGGIDRVADRRLVRTPRGGAA